MNAELLDRAAEAARRAWAGDEIADSQPWTDLSGHAKRAYRELAEAVAAVLEPPCTCGTAGPDEFGNYDQIDNPDCVRCGPAPAESENHRPLEDQ